MSQYRIELGKSGENEAEKFLKKSGYKILERNYRTRYGEIDIIAKDKDVLVFVEVKNRKDNKYGEPEEAVTFHKQKQISKVAVHYLTCNKFFQTACRFDVVSISDFEKNSDKKIKLIKNAFMLSTTYPV
ncbi:YraN family protein [Candidatus Poribacteria bacterium]|nr:YraN family protein [Candidatus Poribacteria bacterium]